MGSIQSNTSAKSKWTLLCFIKLGIFCSIHVKIWPMICCSFGEFGLVRRISWENYYGCFCSSRGHWYKLTLELVIQTSDSKNLPRYVFYVFLEPVYIINWIKCLLYALYSKFITLNPFYMPVILYIKPYNYGITLNITCIYRIFQHLALIYITLQRKFVYSKFSLYFKGEFKI